MKDELISFQTAVLAKEKGFNIPVNCYSNVVEPDRVIEVGAFNHNFLEHGATVVSRPTQSLLQRWIRETCGIHISIEFEFEEDITPLYSYDVFNIKTGSRINYFESFTTYEEALEDGIMVALNMIK